MHLMTDRLPTLLFNFRTQNPESVALRTEILGRALTGRQELGFPGIDWRKGPAAMEIQTRTLGNERSYASCTRPRFSQPHHDKIKGA